LYLDDRDGDTVPEQKAQPRGISSLKRDGIIKLFDDDIARIEQFTSATDQYRFVDHVTYQSVDKLLLCFTDAVINWFHLSTVHCSNR